MWVAPARVQKGGAGPRREDAMAVRVCSADHKSVGVSTGRVRGSRWCRAVAAPAAIVAAVLLARAALATPPTTEFLPETTAQLNAVVKVAKASKTSIDTLARRCYRKPIKDASTNRPYDGAALAGCVQVTRTKWQGATSGLVPSSRDARETSVLPDALAEWGGAGGAFDELDLELRRAVGMLYCCGTVPFPSGSNFSGFVPDPVSSGDPNCTFSNLDKADKAIGKLHDDLNNCHVNLVKKSKKGIAFPLDQCEAKANGKFNAKIAKIPGLPTCAQAAFSTGRKPVSSIANQEIDTIRLTAGTISSQGTPLDAWGCCQISALSNSLQCKDVKSAADCADPTNFKLHVLCDPGGVCEPKDCPTSVPLGVPDANDCPAGSDLDCHNCEAVCGKCNVCNRNHVCDGLENHDNCPDDCPLSTPSVCGDGTCDSTEVCNACNTSCCCEDCGCPVGGTGGCISSFPFCFKTTGAEYCTK